MNEEEELGALGRRLTDLGYRLRRTSCFAETELWVFTVPVPVGEPVGHVIEASVSLYYGKSGWTARVTAHGGPHWIRRARTCAELEPIALQALGTTKRPPTNEWTISEEWLPER